MKNFRSIDRAHRSNRPDNWGVIRSEDWKTLQVGAEALSGLIGGVLAALAVKLSLLVLGSIAITGGLLLLFAARQKSADRTATR
jgi:hypothetical protein